MMDKVLERFVCGAWDNLGEKEVVKLIGTKGVEWDELTREELKGEPDFDYNAVGANVELAMSEARKKNQRETLDTLIKDPDMKKQLNPKMLAAELLEVGEFEEEKIKRLLDVAHYGSEDALSRADEACELIMRGKQPKIYPGADLAFFQYIYDFAVNLDEGEAKKKVELMAYGRAHLQLVVRNMAQKAMIQKTMQAGEAAAAGNAGGADAKGNPQQPPQQPPMTPLQQIQARIKAKTAKNFNLGNAPTGQQGVPAGVVGASAGGQSQTSILQGQ